MGPVLLLFAVSLLHLCEAQGTSTGTPVFVQTGKDLILDVMKPVTLEEGSDFTWRLNGSNNIIKLSFHDNTPTIFKNYKGRADFSVQNHSLLLKNVHKNDSGDYTATVSGETLQPVAEYKVTVQDPVSPVKLTVDSVSNSSDSCNLTVTCSTNDSHISSTFRCDNQNCSQEGGEATTYPSSVNVYLELGVIICNHSNHVSLKQDRKEIKSFCVPPPVTVTNTEIVIGLSCGAVLAAVLIGICLFMKRNQSSPNSEYKSYRRCFRSFSNLHLLPRTVSHWT